MLNLARDFKFGIRTPLRHPTTTVISLVTLTLGIGASNAVFQIDPMDDIVGRNTRSIDDLSNLLTGFSVLALIPALKAARIDPVTALHDE